MYTYAVWVISWAMWVYNYNTTQGFLLVSRYWYKGLVVLLNKFVLVLFHSHLDMLELKLLQNLKSEAAWA